MAAIKFRGVNAVTNFDITRYDVERIMESNGLLPGDLARRSKEAPVPLISSSKESCTNANDWKMALHHDKPSLEAFPAEPNALVGIDSGGAHLSAASSLVTSLGSSREGSPADQPIQFHPLPSKFLPCPMRGADAAAWVPAATRMRPQVPLFSAWAADAV